jgi:hypothetical protein
VLPRRHHGGREPGERRNAAHLVRGQAILGDTVTDDTDVEPSGIQDAIQAFCEACDKKDWKEAEQAFKDMWRLVDDDSSEESEGDDKEEKSGKKPLATLIFGKK